MKTEPKKYEIKTFENLINVVNTENFERFSIDFLLWLNYSVNMIDKLREKNKNGCKGKENWDLVHVTFNWIDDGENYLKGAKITNSKTGEVEEINFKTK